MRNPDSPVASAAATPAASPHPTLATLRARADALSRTAAECCRQHAYYARLLCWDVCAAEQRTACKVAKLYDELLEEMVHAYEAAAARVPGPVGEEWQHCANMLLQASRNHLRHLRRCDQAARQLGSQRLDELDELTAEYELGASALLALHRAAVSYRKLQPAAAPNGAARSPSSTGAPQ